MNETAPIAIRDLLENGAGGDVAIGAPGRPDLTYDGLRGLVDRTGAALAALGVAPGDRVAIVLPNGPAMASCFLAVAAYATAAPLNPAYREDEFDFYISDLRARILVVLQGMETPARAVAAKHGVPVVELIEDEGGAAGDFALDLGGRAPGTARRAGPSDTALVLHTSGTTSRPKIVPLAGSNLAASARHIATTLRLSPADRCLNIMPLFHIHGLIAAVLSSMQAGASVHCSPGFDALRVFRWFEEVKPTWYTAVPTMHQAILGRAGRNAETVAAMKLRFIRSSSSSLPPQVMTELEATFGCPVIESYGMTEASHQMTSNPLPPAARYPGSVGIAAGPEVRILGLDGKFQPAGAEGEIVIRGPNVTAGYENNEKANAEGFAPDPDGRGGRWFRTGDQGTMDADGYLRITGRIKEIINRGGEKIAPREVDEVLMDHPAVAQAVTFAVPHPKLGEEVGAAVVLRDGASATDAELKQFVSARLADFKVPRTLLLVDEIPKGATGKLQRIGLAEKLGLGAKAS
ncbi:AMP-dependent synthetase [Thalassobaculum fulvum]|uniref:AMP-dependent synthetase n=1 Tax=Thalassobaculum fulvum TaxID=1633335 RepID=A0A919CNF0_9PROT|nr:acyl--CoA ligase [Thalassobaculum fulvum]GHD43514.1 AMP-dependent synthetase [Thalassobaculum fulvum]